MSGVSPAPCNIHAARLDRASRPQNPSARSVNHRRAEHGGAGELAIHHQAPRCRNRRQQQHRCRAADHASRYGHLEVPIHRLCSSVLKLTFRCNWDLVLTPLGCFLSPQGCSPSSTSTRSRPCSVSAYSTRSGTSGYDVHSPRPSASNSSRINSFHRP
jgi:hypothetical protein